MNGYETSLIGIALYNLLMAVVVAAALFYVAQRRRAVSLLAVLVVVVAAATMMALTIGMSVMHDRFGALRLLGHGIFGHLTLALLGCAALLWRHARRPAIASLVFVAIICGIGIDAYFIEPHSLDVTRHRIASPKITSPITIAVLADLQTDDVGPYERMVFERIMQEQPDLILLAGDYLQISDPQLRAAQRQRLRQIIKDVQFSAPLGVFAVQGNVDSGDWTKIFAGFSVTPIVNTRSIDLPHDQLRLTALAMRDSFDRDLRVEPSDRFQICLGHCPDFALGSNTADLLVAGHTHGGQVRLPLIGPLVTLSKVSRKQAAGLTEIEPDRHLLVSRGIGMERHNAPRLRFLCRPELVFIELVPQ